MRYYLDVITILAQKDFKIRYRNSVLGFIWSILNPLAYMVILTFVFSFLLRVTIPNYPAWILIGILVWRFFSIATSQGLSSIIGNASLVTKVHLSRYVIVLSNNVGNLLGTTIEFLVMLPLLVILGVNLSAYTLFLPVILIFEFLLVFALSLSLSSLNLKYRDFYQIWDIALQLGFYVSPIVYDSTLVPSRFKFVYSLNPMARLIESTRSILLLRQLPSLYDITVMLTGICILLVLGFVIFSSLESRFAEEL